MMLPLLHSCPESKEFHILYFMTGEGEMKEFTEKAFIQNSSQININQKKSNKWKKIQQEILMRFLSMTNSN
jgi:hypothetical protein